MSFCLAEHGASVHHTHAGRLVDAMKRIAEADEG